MSLFTSTLQTKRDQAWSSSRHVVPTALAGTGSSICLIWWWIAGADKWEGRQEMEQDLALGHHRRLHGSRHRHHCRRCPFDLPQRQGLQLLRRHVTAPNQRGKERRVQQVQVPHASHSSYTRYPAGTTSMDAAQFHAGSLQEKAQLTASNSRSVVTQQSGSPVYNFALHEIYVWIFFTTRNK